MKTAIKRLFSLLLTLAVIGAMFPAAYAAEARELSAEVVEESAYVSADAVFDSIDRMEASPAKKSATQTQLSDAAEDIVVASNSYLEGSLVRNGDSFTWWTTDGIRCIYNPYIRDKHENMVAPENPLADGIYNEPAATRGGWPSGNQVYLVAPYYGHDSTFTDQYKKEATAAAAAIGDTDGYTLYSGTACTVDKVAEAVSKGAIVYFDSHGTTDYESGYDYVTGATSSYLCLTSTTGLTTEDYNDGAQYYSDGICINGATISNHMTSNSPGGILWMAICLGMATNTICEPLRARGVEVVYGYSQSVTFDGDYCFEEVFWDNMYAGKNVAASVAAMKAQYGNWDGSIQIGNACGWSSNEICYSISEAREYYYAFPIVVSDEDTHPGQRKGSFYGADSLQTVKSTYTLFSQYDITAKTNNTAYGTVSVSGNVITATPKTGYFAQGYTVTSGTAAVTQNGNSFTVMASTDCTVQINFAPKTAVTVSFSGANVAAQSGYGGDAMTLPTVTAPEGFTFIGWMTSPMTQDSTEKPAYYTGSFTPTASTTLYALYSFVDENSGTGTGDYVKVTSTPADWSGEYLIVYEADGCIFDSTLSKMDATSNYQSVTITDDTIAAAQGDPYKFVIEEYNGGYSIKAASGMYIGRSDNTNGLESGSSAMKNTITLDGNGNANIVGAGGAYLRYNATSGQYRFRYYKSSTYSSQKAIALYLKDGSAGTTWFTGSPVKCAHSNTTNTAAVAATCTQGGYTAGVYCNDCKQYIEGHTPVDPLGHSYGSVVTPPTATEQGYTTYTCENCGDSYVSDYVEALGYTYTVSFCVPTGVTAIENMQCGKNGINLPAATAPAGYTFAGWTTAATEDTETAPTIYTGTYTATEDTTLYALYTYTVGGSGETDYVLTDLADISESDEVVITMTYDSTVYALPNNGGASAPAAPTVTVSGDKLATTPADTLLWNVKANGSNYSFYVNGGTDTLYCTDTNKGVKIGTSTANVFVLDASGYLKNTSYNRFLGVYRTNPDWRCYTSTTTNIGDQTLGFYVKGQAGTTYYTTLDAEATPEPELFDLGGSRMILGNSLEMQFAVVKANMSDWTGAYAVVAKTWADGSVTEQIIPVTEFQAYGSTHYLVCYNGMAAKEMADELAVTIYNAKGQAVSNTWIDSARAYVMRNVDSQSPAVQKLMVDMLNYGAAAQVNFNYGTDDLANNQLTDAQKAYGTAVAPENTNGMVAAPNFMGSRLVLESSIQMQLAFSGVTTDMYAQYKFTDHNGNARVVDVKSDEFIAVGNFYCVNLGELVYADARALVEVTIYNADGSVYAVGIDSIEGYAARYSSVTLVGELMKFADSAYAYFH